MTDRPGRSLTPPDAWPDDDARFGADEQALAAWAGAAIAPAEPSPSVRRRLLSTLGGPERFRPFMDRVAQMFDLRPGAIAELLRRIDDPSGWLDAPMPGVRYFHFQAGPALAGLETGVVRLAPGATFARHRHRGPEQTFVLDGFVEEGGGVYGPGAVLEMPGGSAHDYRARPGRDLVLLSRHAGIDFEPA